MKKFAFIIASLLLLSTNGYSQSAKEDIIGVWINEHNDSKVEYYIGADSLFYGKLVWVKEAKHQDRVGLVFIKGMKYDSQSNTWKTDYMFSPDHNMVAKGVLRLEDGILYVKGRKFGISATERFTRVN
ncbi:MAG: DUF2147 domain-containing protein [Bacteroidales bacterium]|nr:DUF2147 domain-containing protein [Bacteroidales bacterium]MDD4669724.1 DUF2147 domain-containing protein [Bacteroidales bacterium]